MYHAWLVLWSHVCVLYVYICVLMCLRGVLNKHFIGNLRTTHVTLTLNVSHHMCHLCLI